MHFFNSINKGNNAEEYNIMGNINTAFIAMMFTALAHALLDCKTGVSKTGAAFIHVKCLSEF